ncbi:MAG TPA: hypothetical protein DIC23_15645 [Planctomycetaceae bacterium]|nr:hypothetical protein [Planctomycetaceae bacterium]
MIIGRRRVLDDLLAPTEPAHRTGPEKPTGAEDHNTDDRADDDPDLFPGRLFRRGNRRSHTRCRFLEITEIIRLAEIVELIKVVEIVDHFQFVFGWKCNHEGLFALRTGHLPPHRVAVLQLQRGLTFRAMDFDRSRHRASPA